MQKVSLAETTPDAGGHPDMQGAVSRQLVSGKTVGSQRGMLVVTDFAPGGYHKLHRHHSAEQVSFLLEGSAEHLTANGPAPISAGTAVYVAPGEWHGFRNTGTATARLVSLYGGAASLAEAGYESFAGEIDETRPPSIRSASLAGQQGDAALDEDAGFFGLGVYWLATREAVGADRVVLGASTFEPGGVHEHHRHPNGDEILFILEGGGEHLTPDGAVPLGAGEVAFIPAGEFHGFRNPPGVTTRTLFGYFGPGSLEEAGYETRDGAQP